MLVVVAFQGGNPRGYVNEVRGDYIISFNGYTSYKNQDEAQSACDRATRAHPEYVFTIETL